MSCATFGQVAHSRAGKASRDRRALKMWTGWPTFPQVLVRGQLVGGAEDLQKLITSGELKTLLAGPRVS